MPRLAEHQKAVLKTAVVDQKKAAQDARDATQKRMEAAIEQHKNISELLDKLKTSGGS